ncbi:ATP synthase subunit C lysine N-methyltransferase isoform X2 [Melopsittacus undulatus]|uniref:ATP synthase subunit C lysine N-methyltransferase isoform X2 n=1 Tax=Melopsittacus undulatus TaxID=13146 RepID=UPI00146BFA1B|nr:ATP synthase subunit C lysine N-methyltransferase isoform X2 [Melopsittacus undulatus]
MCKVVANDSRAPPPQDDCKGASRERSWGLLVTAGVGGTLVALYAVVTPFVTPALRKVCLPFVPATSTQIHNVLRMLENRSGSLVDIGSGDGRIVSSLFSCSFYWWIIFPQIQVIAAAKMGFKAVGYELNPWLVWYSRYRAWRDGVHHNTRFYISDLWKMPQLEKKLEEELKCNARIIACRFPFPCWIPDHTTGEGIDTVWAYDLKHSRGCETKRLEISPETKS